MTAQADTLPLISVVIPSYNSRKSIAACLHSLASQQTSHPFEIVIADSSNDGTDTLIRDQYPQVHLIRLEQRTYPGPARNAAAQSARGDVLAFVDTDCTVPSNWIEQIAAAHEQGYQVVGGAVLNGTPRSYVGTAEYISEFSEYSPRRQPGDSWMIPTCNLSLRKAIFEDVGRFETVETGRLLFKSEDALLCERLRRNGYRIRFAPSIQVCHHNRVELKHFFANQRSLGFSSAVLRRLLTMKGSVLTRSSLLCLLIPVIKMVILLRRMAAYGISDLFLLLLHVPLIFAGTVSYAVGFLTGMRFSLKASLDDDP